MYKTNLRQTLHSQGWDPTQVKKTKDIQVKLSFGPFHHRIFSYQVSRLLSRVPGNRYKASE